MITEIIRMYCKRRITISDSYNLNCCFYIGINHFKAREEISLKKTRKTVNHC